MQDWGTFTSGFLRCSRAHITAVVTSDASQHDPLPNTATTKLYQGSDHSKGGYLLSKHLLLLHKHDLVSRLHVCQAP